MKATKRPLARRLAKRRRTRGQAMAETALLTTLLIGWGGAMMFFFPDAANSLQIYIDGFYVMLSLPIP
jgi:hypothetical protein